MGTTIGDLVRRNAERHPGKIAYIYGTDLRHTWHEFNERVNRLANALRDRGCRPGEVVASLTADGPVLNEVFFALAKIGAVRVGVNYRYSAAEVQRLLQHSGASRIIVQDDFLSLLGDSAAVEVIGCGDGCRALGAYGELLDASVPAEPASTVTEADLAAYCYTTGSTGRPKGACWTNRNVVESISHTAFEAGLRPDDIWLHCLPGAGVPGLLAIWNAVLGWCNVIIPQFSPSACLDAIEAHQVTATVWVPTMVHAVVLEQQRQPRTVDSLRKIVYGSAPSTPALIRRTSGAFPGAELEQWYGSTEGAGGWFTRLDDAHHRAALAGEEHLLTSCGKPMHHVDVVIRDDRGQNSAPGELGEICVRGACVMAGYHDEPELTAERLDGPWLRTGDIGYADEQGFIYIADRKEFMIISGGYNVYPIEVENALADHPAVAEVAVFGVPDERWGERVTAAVSLSPDAQIDLDQVQAFCRGKLASFKIPRDLLVRDQLPYGPTGKLLKRQLIQEAIAARAAASSAD